MGEVDVHGQNSNITWPAMPGVPIGHIAITGVWHVASTTGREVLSYNVWSVVRAACSGVVGELLYRLWL